MKKHGSTLFLRAAILAVGLVVLAICAFALPALWIDVAREYHHITYALYGILSAMYLAAIPFFIALYQAFKLLSYVDKDRVFSKLSIKALRRIIQCGVVISAIYAVSVPFFYVWAENDDAPGLIIIGLIMTMAPLVASVFAAVVLRLLRQVLAIKSENDLTV
jgi:hypothetical protein